MTGIKDDDADALHDATPSAIGLLDTLFTRRIGLLK